MAKKDGSQRPVLLLLVGNVLLGYNHDTGVLRSFSVFSGWKVKRAKRAHGPTCTWEKRLWALGKKGKLVWCLCGMGRGRRCSVSHWGWFCTGTEILSFSYPSFFQRLSGALQTWDNWYNIWKHMRSNCCSLSSAEQEQKLLLALPLTLGQHGLHFTLLWRKWTQL